MSRCRHATPALTPTAVTSAEVAAEPFRLFFPWAAVSGCAGVLLWPLYLLHYTPFHPALAHSRLMIFGFGGACVLGFLGTAGPRMLGAKAFSALETGALFLLHATAIIAAALMADRAACGLFAGTLTLLLALMARRFIARTDMPPPGFVLAFMGLLSGICGASLAALQWDIQSPLLYRFSHLLTNEALLLLPLLGIGGFLFPQLLSINSRQRFPDGRSPAPGWLRIAAEAGLVGGIVLTSLYLEASGYVRFGPTLRFVTVIAWWQRDLPELWRAKTNGTQSWALKVGLAFVAGSLLVRALDPARYIAAEHLLFITGFGLTILSVATRVIYGHSGHRAATKGVSKPMRWIVWLLVLAMLTRVSADYVPSIQTSHYIYAALTWVIVSVIWLRDVWSKVRTADTEP